MRIVLLLPLVLTAAPARADHCHPPLQPPPPTTALTAQLNLEAAAYRTATLSGSWSGMAAELGGSLGRWQGRSWVNAYRLERNQVVSHGPGDAGLELRFTAYTTSDGGGTFGPSLAVSLPTGDPDAGLGMGHVMAMPGLWWSQVAGAFSVGAGVSYGRALADISGHQHGPSSLVHPMNASELAAAGGIGWSPVHALRLDANASLTRPIFLQRGVSRGSGGVGITWTSGRLALGASVRLPLAGDPYRLRVLAGSTFTM